MSIKRLFPNFFEHKKVLVTGHTGFMGSWLSIWLLELGAEVIGYALPPYTEKDNFVVSGLKEKLTNIYGDIRNYDKVSHVFTDHKPDIIFHLAAQPIVRKSYDIPKETFDTNVGGTVNIMEAFKNEKSCKVLINITSDKCYKNEEKLEGYCEEDKLGGFDPYSASKACSELVTSAYANSYFKFNTSQNNKIISTARSGNIIGGGDWQKDRLIPDFMKAFLNDEEVLLRNPKAIRPWQHVLEPVFGYLKLAKKMWNGSQKYSGAWNFGPEEDFVYTVEDLIKGIIHDLGKGGYRVSRKSSEEKLHETSTLLLNCTKANNILEWHPVLQFDEIVKYICDWYLEEKVDYEFDVMQIKKYSKKVLNS